MPNLRKVPSEVDEPFGNWAIYAHAGDRGSSSPKLRGPKTEGERNPRSSRLVICRRSI